MAPSLAARSAAIFVEKRWFNWVRSGLSSRQPPRARSRSPTDTRSWFSRAATSEAAASVPVDCVVIALSVSDTASHDLRRRVARYSSSFKIMGSKPRI